MGWVFGDLCRAQVASERLPGFVPLRLGAYFTHDHAVQVDLVATAPSERLLVGECKWARVAGATLAKLRADAALLQAELGTRGAPLLVLCAGFGETDATVDAACAAGDVRVVTGEAIARGEPS